MDTDDLLIGVPEMGDQCPDGAEVGAVAGSRTARAVRAATHGRLPEPRGRPAESLQDEVAGHSPTTQ